MGARDDYQRAGELFDVLVDLPEAARTQRLSEVDADDPAVATLVRSMLAEDDAVAGVDPLDPSAGGAAEVVVGHEDDPAGVVGSALGPYLIESLIGRGAMGAVYRARRHEPDETVAIKFMSLDAAPAHAAERFRLETESLAAVRHPRIVGYRDSGIDRRGRPYIVMEYVDGVPLRWSLDPIRTSVRDTVALLLDVIDAVHHLHQGGILHRDLKPSNILVRTGRDGSPEPVVIDLGIVRRIAAPSDAAGAGAGATTGATAPGAMTMSIGFGPVGTPAYMSPEQSKGDVRPDVRMDVHALGAVLYELLTGHPPRGLDEITSADPVAIHRRLRETDARPPSDAVDPECFGGLADGRRAAIDRDLDAVVLKALDRDLERRYGSVEKFGDDLRRWLERRPVEARLIGPAGRFVRLVQRRPLPVAAAAGVLAVIVGASVFSMVSARNERVARLAFAEQLATTEAVNGFIIEDLLAQAGVDAVGGGPEIRAIELIRWAATRVENRFQDRPALETDIRATLLSTFARMRLDEDAAVQLESGLESSARLDLFHPQRLRFDVVRISALQEFGRIEDAIDLGRSVIGRLESVAARPGADQSSGWWTPLLGSAESAVAAALIERNRFEEAELLARRSIGRFAESDQRWSEAMGNILLIKYHSDGAAAAVDDFEAFAADAERRYGAGHPITISAQGNAALLYLALVQPNEAMPWAERAVAAAERTYGNGHPGHLGTLNQLASVASQLRDYDRAIPLRRQVVEGRRAAFGSDSYTYAIALNNLASTLCRAGHHDQAIEPARDAVELLGRIADPDDSTLGHALLTQAVAEAGIGDRGVAMELARRAIDVFRDAEGDQSGGAEDAREYLERLEAAEADSNPAD